MSPVFAGREAELAVLGRAFEMRATACRARCWSARRSAGGKSRLVNEFAARVAGRALVLAGGCVELAGTGLPYAPFTAALRGLVRERGPAGVTGLLGGRGAGELAALLPEFGAPPRALTRLRPAPGCSSCCLACSRRWRSGGRWCWWWRTCTGPTTPPVTC